MYLLIAVSLPASVDLMTDSCASRQRLARDSCLYSTLLSVHVHRWFGGGWKSTVFSHKIDIMVGDYARGKAHQENLRLA